ncbi:MAG: carbohydrate-binding family 9-like protein [Gammaproteobacteria bacterium]|nr:carbohydrate-binding family 9-like protein [Gammaproteobacteria bacterium]
MTIREYQCQRVARQPALNGFVTGEIWDSLPWTDSFVDITGLAEHAPAFLTRAKMGWDDHFFYIAAELEEPHVWGTLKDTNAIIFEDNDFEIFIDPDGDGLNYYEFEINALGTIWELSLPKPYKDGGIPQLGCNLDGLVSAVGIKGTLNNPADLDEGWSVTVAIPWPGLKRFHLNGAVPPTVSDTWRINFSRVQWDHTIVDGGYERVPPHGTKTAQSLNPEEQDHPEYNWVWSPQGKINMHLPERWGRVTFVD